MKVARIATRRCRWLAVAKYPLTRLVEPDRLRILLEHPEVDAGAWPSRHDQLRDAVEQLRSNSAPLRSARHMKVVDKRAPLGVAVERHVRESDRATVLLSDQREILQGVPSDLIRPRRQTVGVQVSVEIAIGIHTSIVTTPAIGMDLRDGWRVARGCVADGH